MTQVHDASTPQAWDATSGTVLRGQALVDLIRADIIAGNLKPGERLTEPSLGKRYNVSRVPVREALRIVLSEGFVELRPYGSATVARLTADVAAEVLSARLLLEPAAAASAASHRSAEDLAELRELLAQGDRVVEERRLTAVPELNTVFHARVARASGNSVICDFIRQLSHKAEWIYAAAAPQRAPSSWCEHWDIYEAIDRRDGEQAARLMRSHIERTAVATRDIIQALDAGQPSAD